MFAQSKNREGEAEFRAAVFSQISVAVLPPIPAPHVIASQSDALPEWQVTV
jgi:hypothetical protein